MKNRILYLISLLLLTAVLFSACSDDTAGPREELQKALNNHILKEGYTAASYGAYDEAYTEAQSVYKNEDATAYDLDQALLKLKAAEKALIRKADFSQLKLAIAANEGIDPALYTEESYGVYLNAYNDALSVYNQDASKQSVINQAIARLNAATRALEKRPDFSALELLMSKQFDKALYTASSYSIYEVAYQNAADLIKKGTAGENELLLAENMLSQAIAGLVLRQTDMTRLSDIVKEMENSILKKDSFGRTPEERYTAESYRLFKAEYDRALALLSSADTDEQGIDKMVNALEKAKKDLVDLTELLNLEEQMPEYTEQAENYTVESYATFLSAMSKGKEVLALPNATAELVENTVKDLQKAIAGLTRKEIKPDGKTDKNLLDTLFTVGVTSVSFREYFADYSAFFLRVVEENQWIAYVTQGDNAVLTAGNVKVVLSKDRVFVTYSGKEVPTVEERALMAFGGLFIDSTEFEITGEKGYGAPTLYTTGFETINGIKTKISTITYYDLEKGAEMVIRYNTEINCVIGMDFQYKAPDQTPDSGGKDQIK